MASIQHHAITGVQLRMEVRQSPSPPESEQFQLLSSDRFVYAHAYAHFGGGLG